MCKLFVLSVAMSLAFLAPSNVAPGKFSSPSAATPCIAPAHAVEPTDAPAQSTAQAVRAVATGVAAGALLATSRNQQRLRASKAKTAMHALGSIEQFKTFGERADTYEIETDKVLGVGGQGTVYQCFKPSDPNTKYAVKTIPIWRLLMDPSSKEKIAAIEQEVDVLLKLQGHPNIGQCIGCFDACKAGTSEPQYKMMVMELIQGGEVAEVIAEKGTLDEDVAKSVLRQTCEGLKFLHSRQVLHRDLKCENILVCGETLTKDTPVKLIDFGVAKSVAGTMGRSAVGTTEIMAPELICAKMMIAPKAIGLRKTYGPFSFKAPQEEPPGFGIVSQRPDGKGAMVKGIAPTGQAAGHSIGDGWAITAINGTDITEMPFIKDFNELDAGSKGGVTAISEILGTLSGEFTAEFIELPKREFSTEVDMWSLGIVLYTMLVGKVPFKTEADIVEGFSLRKLKADEAALASVSPQAKDLIQKLLVLDPAGRAKMDEVLAHPWLA